MDFKQLLENSVFSRYTETDSVIAFSTIIIASIVALLISVKPFSEQSNGFDTHLYHSVTLPKQSKQTHTARRKQTKTLTKLITIKKGDTLLAIFKKNHIKSAELSQILQLGEITHPLHNLIPFRQLRLSFSPNHQFQAVAYHFSAARWLVIQRNSNGYKAHIEKQKLESHVHFTHATISQSLYTAGHKAGLSDYLIYEIINNFAWDIDFAKEIRPGDHFSVIYNDYYLGDKKMREGDILAAAFTSRGKTFQIVRYNNPKGKSAYYTPNGRSVKKAFMRTPVKYKRISSSFRLARKHPILHTIRAHRGVDYAAPHGTPIRATSDGKITMRRVNGGYGNVVMIKHGLKYTTVYGHMSRFARNLKVGRHVKQGQIIGYVGQTGLASGPHLHYEIRILGKYVNPQKVQLPRAAPVPQKYRKDFYAKTQAIMAELKLYQSALAASKKTL